MSLPYAHRAANFLPRHEAMACLVVACMLPLPGQARTRQDRISPTDSGWVGLGPAGHLDGRVRVVTCTSPAWFQEALLQAPAASV